MLSVSSDRPWRNQNPSSSMLAQSPCTQTPGEPPPIRVEVALVVAPDAARHGGPRLFADELPHLARGDRRSVGAPDVDVHPERGTSERAGLQLRDRQRREEARADLGAARQVDDRAPAAADLLQQPPVRLGVPRLTGRCQDPQGREVVRANGFDAARDQRADQRRRDAQRRDAVTLDRRPQPIGTREVRRSFGEHHGRTQARARRRSPTAP